MGIWRRESKQTFFAGAGSVRSSWLLTLGPAVPLVIGEKQIGQSTSPLSKVGVASMKNSWFTGALAGVLVVAAFAAALLVARVFLTTRQLRSLQPMLVEVNNRLNFAQALLNETLEYSKRNPAIDPLLVSLNF
ncbi:MAG: hypothetical protein DME19_20310, partial [Verrucomicrobia bacterium]